MISLDTAEAISEAMCDTWDLPKLCREAKITLVERLSDFEEAGWEQGMFDQDYAFPNPNDTNRKIDKIVGLIKKMQAALNDPSETGRAAKTTLVSSSVGGEPGAVAQDRKRLSEWIAHTDELAKKFAETKPSFRAPHDEPAPTKMQFKTYLMGSAIPDLFSDLYGFNKFGSHNPQNDYNCAGVHFIFECCQELGIEEVNYSQISKSVQRSKGKFHSYFEAYADFVEECLYERGKAK
jgi:hypothetical protein